MKNQTLHPNNPASLDWEKNTYSDYPADVQRTLYQQRAYVRAALEAIDGSRIKLIIATSKSDSPYVAVV